MTGEQHYREAERLARWAGDYDGEAQPDNAHIQAAQIAQVYAMLALASSDERVARLEERIRRLEEADEVDGLADRIEAIERMLLADEEAIKR